MTRPTPFVQTLHLHDRAIHVLRDDLLPGGSKQRAALPYLLELLAQGWQHFAYASPFCGFAQVALAAAAQQLGVACHLFCAADAAHLPQLRRHEFTELARSMGAELRLFADLAQAQAAARRFVAEGPQRYEVPLGFADDGFLRLMAHEVAWVWTEIVAQLGSEPPRVWLGVGSGTLSRCLRQTLPDHVELMCVNVRVLDRADERLRSLERLPRLQLLHTEEAFHEPAVQAPPLPSNAHYDAKLWRHLVQQGREGDLWWNVAR